MGEVTSEHVYAETCANIRATDEISFKLLGIVPLLSGATLVTFFLKGPVAVEKAPLIITLSLFAALITLGLFRWELRNIQTCSWLRSRAEALERSIVASAKTPQQPKPPLRIAFAACILIVTLLSAFWPIRVTNPSFTSPTLSDTKP